MKIKDFDSLYGEIDEKGLERVILHDEIHIEDEKLKVLVNDYLNARTTLRDYIVLKMNEEATRAKDGHGG